MGKRVLLSWSRGIDDGGRASGPEGEKGRGPRLHRRRTGTTETGRGRDLLAHSDAQKMKEFIREASVAVNAADGAVRGLRWWIVS
eukprot:7617847-Lingulodinium_polyedra.AAC.1